MKVLLEYLGIKESGPILTLGIAKGFVENGHEVYIILSDKIENKTNWLEGFPRDRLFFINTTPKRNNLIYSTASFLHDCFLIKRKFRNIKFDCFITTFLVLGGWDKIICNLIKADRKFTLIHDPIPHSSMPEKESIKYRKLVKISNEIVVLTKKFIPIIESEYGFSLQRIHYMRHGKMNFLETKKQNIRGDIHKFTFLFFGRIDGYKGIDVLLDAYEVISKEYTDKVELRIAGNGDFSKYKNKFNLLMNKTLINRYIDDSEIPDLFSATGTILVLPYIDATQSGVTPLAFQFSVPVIASDTGGLKEQLFDGEVGSFFEAGDTNGLYKVMKQFLDNKKLYFEESERMKEYSEKLEWSSVIKEFVQSIWG